MIWAITSYFNPVRSWRRLVNYRTFRSKLRIPLVAVELSFDGQFELTRDDADILVQLSGGALLWQKERLLNVGLQSVPAGVENVALLDCDVVFEREDWAEATEAKLHEQYNIIQLFSEALYLIKDSPLGKGGSETIEYDISAPGLVQTGDPSLMGQGAVIHGHTRLRYQPGLAWALKRAILDQHYLYDAAIVGGADILMAASAYGYFEPVTNRHLFNSRRKQHYADWAVPFNKRIAGRIGALQGTVYHLWHGELKNRNYYDRYKLLDSFDPYVDVQIADNGAWRWTKPNTEFEEKLRDILLARLEDG
jgi:hypothetical protein